MRSIQSRGNGSAHFRLERSNNFGLSVRSYQFQTNIHVHTREANPWLIQKKSEIIFLCLYSALIHLFILAKFNFVFGMDRWRACVHLPAGDKEFGLLLRVIRKTSALKLIVYSIVREPLFYMCANVTDLLHLGSNKNDVFSLFEQEKLIFFFEGICFSIWVLPRLEKGRIIHFSGQNVSIYKHTHTHISVKIKSKTRRFLLFYTKLIWQHITNNKAFFHS